MQRLAMIGLGRMDMNMTKRLLDGGVEVVAHTRTRARVELGVPLPVISAALFSRFQSRLPDGFGNRVLAALVERIRSGTAAAVPAGRIRCQGGTVWFVGRQV